MRDEVDELAATLHALRVTRESWLQRTRRRLLTPPKHLRPMGLVSVQMSINPFELFLLLSVCIVGVLYLIGLQPPTSVQQLLPPLAVKVWAANLAMGGLSALIGGTWRFNLERGLLAYQFGWVLVGIGSLIYGVAVFILFPDTRTYPAVTNVMLSLACFMRVIQVQRFFKLSETLIHTNLDGPVAGLGAFTTHARGGKS